MKKFKNILFVSQGLSNHSDSIGQALRLSYNNKAPLKGMIFCPPLPVNLAQYQSSYENSLIHNVSEHIKDSRDTHNIAEDDVSFPLEVVSGEKPAINIIRAVHKGEHDLLIKDAEPLDDDGEGFKAIDMTLLRKCPSPVWLNRASNKPRNKRRVAVAIDPIIASDEHRGLCMRLMELSRSIADSCDSRLHVLSCWEYQLERYLDSHAWIKIGDKELNAEIEKAKVEHKEALDHLINESGVSGEIIVHHLHGLPDDVIPHWVDEHEIDILVMGTLARTGIPGFVIGNTAENIVRSVTCSLVALKPKGFVTPFV
ncbi:universal stress protein [Vibrio breoganii]|uniref:universal stress protein n=1 Tax=Vibrio breoganii TaxID=553239 RepID=UPI000C81FE77|nr:universal stress protein [Vibrio breoganii]PMO56493.1 universal stress protein [Vibrio breoganii]